jgi:hypothetical protein
MFRRALSGRRFTGSAAVAAVVTGLVVSACGGSGPRQDAYEPSGKFPVAVSTATFPTSQSLSEHTNLKLVIRNSGSQTIPNIAVTILNAAPGQGTAAQSFGQLIPAPAPGQPILASRSRAVWIIDQPPGPCEYSCQQGGPGGAVTAYSDTWAEGKLKPGATAVFDWGVTAVQPGTYKVEYQIAAGLNGKAKAVGSTGGPVQGTFNVTITSKPRQAYVNNSGQVVYTK